MKIIEVQESEADFDFMIYLSLYFGIYVLYIVFLACPVFK